VTLIGIHHPLASSKEQLRVLEQGPRTRKAFRRALEESALFPLRATGITVLQVNVGKLCNQTCHHCHVDAGPDRREVMSREVAELCIRALASFNIRALDITGGAPELNPNFRWLVEQGRKLGRQVMDRSNLTVLTLPSQQDLVDFLAQHRVEIHASLPYYLPEPHDAQRGEGVFQRSLEALRKLNEAGYGQPGTGLVLNLVYNPTGAFLPAPQRSLEADFRAELGKRHGIVFNLLHTITNMPISRFLEFLIRTGNYERYMEKLTQAFNPAAAAGVMCRYTLSVGWDGTLYDCDFNQMLDLPLENGYSRHIRDLDPEIVSRRLIVMGEHCYGCTAGSGSCCGGAIVA
jgi:radical SAM/Cys-rich protein